MRRKNGFTITEMIMALLAGTVLIGGILAVYIMSIRSWREGSIDAGLERTAGLVMEKLARGANGRFGLREADIGTVQVSADGTSVTYMVDKQDPPTPWNSDDVTCRYYKSGTRIFYDPNTAVSGDEQVLTRFGDVEQLTFSLSGDVLTANLVMTAKAPRTERYKLGLRMQTNIFFRKRR